MADLVISPLVKKLGDYLIKYLATQYELGSNINKKLEDVKQSLLQIQAVVSDAEDVEIKKEYVAAWLSKLEEAVYEAEDLLDEFEYRRLEIQAKNASEEKTSKVRDKFSKFLKRFTDRELLKKLVSIQERLKNLAGEIGGLREHISKESSGWESRKKEAQEQRETTSFVSEPGFVGREEVLKEIIPLLLMREPNGRIRHEIPVVSVVGQGGFGKTTLVRQVFNQKEVKGHFEVTLWGHVSQSFDLKRLVRKIIESVPGNSSRAETLEGLQHELKEVVGSNRFLLVLDDMWCDNEWSKTQDNWRNLLAPLMEGARERGSMILVTSRDEKMKNLPGALCTFILEPLNVQECWSIIKAHAFCSDDQIPECLNEIGLKIATKVRGSPLAAKVVGGILHDTREYNGWNKILNTELRDLGSVMEVLKLSYRHLPPNLRKCFAYCSLFPKGHYFRNSEVLGRMWVAQGFIQPRVGESIDEAGRECFNYLLSRSFFQKHFLSSGSEYYVMHDLIHDLAQHVSQGDCLGFERDNHLKGEIPYTVRHISLFTASHLSHLTKTGFKFGNLRSLLVIDHPWPTDIWHFTEVFSLLVIDHPWPTDIWHFTEVFSQLRHVRVLHLECYFSTHLPEVVGDWIHLRYLHLKLSSDSKRLPQSLSRLYHLQVFVIENRKLELLSVELPKKMNKLINLRILEGQNCDSSPPQIAFIERWTFLEVLNWPFHVKRERGYDVGQLKALDGLRGMLKIENLENVESGQEAEATNLRAKTGLVSLHLSWGDKRDIPLPEVDGDVLEALQPNSNLKALAIRGYAASTCPSWMCNQWLSILETVKLYNLRALVQLPSLGQLPYLRCLYLNTLPLVKKLGGQDFYGHASKTFPSLKELVMFNMAALEEWSEPDEDSPYFPHLQVLQIEDCPKLRSLPPLAKQPSLVTLKMRRLNAITEMCVLHVGFLHNQDGLRNLRTLEISDCRELVSIGEVGFGDLTSLEILTIEGCPKLTWVTNINGQFLPSSLVKLSIDECGGFGNIISWSQCLQGLTNLTKLKIGKTMPEATLPTPEEVTGTTFLSSLKFLEIDVLLPIISTISTLTKFRVTGKLEGTCLPLAVEEFLSQNCTTLTSFTLSKTPSLKYIPECLKDMSSLQALYLLDAPELQELPHLPDSLYSLYVCHANPEFVKKYEREKGSDWLKIRNVRDINISTSIS